jgi:F-type H+-transporting ATPase subunit epsilon
MASDSGGLSVRVLTPDGAVFDGTASMVFAPSEGGEVGLLPRHEPLVCTLGYGRTRVQSLDGDEEVFATSRGFLTIERDEVLVLVDQAIPVDQIDVARARADIDAAEQAIEAAGDDDVARARAEANKLRAENLLHVMESHK